MIARRSHLGARAQGPWNREAIRGAIGMTFILLGFEVSYFSTRTKLVSLELVSLQLVRM